MPKAKISVTIERDLVTELDEAAKSTSRSEIVERALATWLRHRRRHQLEQDIARYYAQITNEDRSEDDSWAELGAGLIDETWS